MTTHTKPGICESCGGSTLRVRTHLQPILRCVSCWRIVTGQSTLGHVRLAPMFDDDNDECGVCQGCNEGGDCIEA